MKYMVDTQVFNHMLDGGLDSTILPSGIELIATHVQWGEIEATGDQERRNQLQKLFTLLTDKIVPTGSFVFGHSKFGQARFSDGKSYTEIKSMLDLKNNGKTNNIQDALIADTARSSGYTLITHDGDLREVSEKIGIECTSIREIRIK
jgi:hypothetical protein